MKYVVACFFAITALVAVLVAFQLQMFKPSVDGMEARKTIALVGFCFAGLLFIVSVSLEKIWRIFKPE